MPLEAVRYALRGGLWPLAPELVGTHVIALAIRGNARELDLLLSAVPRDALLRHPELAAGLAASRTHLGSNREVGELVAAALVGTDDLPPPRAQRLRVVLDLVEMGHARSRGDLIALGAAARRVPDDPRRLSALGLAGWDVIPLVALGGAGTAELWTGDVTEAEKHLRAAVDANQWSGFLRPHLNAASHLALLLGERGDLDAAEAEAQAAVDRAAEAGWAVSGQAVAAYLALAWVSLDRSEPEGVSRWLGKVAEVEAISPEPHVQLAAAGLNALRRADAGDRSEHARHRAPSSHCARTAFRAADRSNHSVEQRPTLHHPQGAKAARPATRQRRPATCLALSSAPDEVADGLPHDDRARRRPSAADLQTEENAMTDTPRTRSDTASPSGYRPSSAPVVSGWTGWVVFAGVMLILLGAFQAIEGLVAVFDRGFYLVGSEGLIVNVDYTVWGWVHLILGMVAVAAGIGLTKGNTAARMLGVVLAVISAILNLAFLAAYPIWSTIVIAVDIIVIYAIVVHGRELQA